MEQHNRLVGALFMIGLPGKTLDASTLSLIRERYIHNFILFKRNVESPKQVKRLCADLRRTCLEAGLPAPIISIDQEGGDVARLPPPFTQFPGARRLAEGSDGFGKLQAYARTCARELADIGVNMNLAPVVDCCPSGQGFFMESRVFDEKPERVANYATMIIEEFHKAGVMACAKHFPGLGAAVLDPHLELPTVEKSFDEIIDHDLYPFRRAAEAGVAAIMTSHALYKNIDPSCPGTLSLPIITGILRQQLAYDGLIITDDLEMGAIEKNGRLAEASLTALLAGVDMLLICHDHQKIIATWQHIVAAVESGKMTKNQIHKSMSRAMFLRDKFGLSGSKKN